MNDFIALMWEQAKDRLYITREQFAQGFDGCEFDTIRGDDGSIFALFVIRGPEFHYVKLSPETVSREHLRKYPGTLIAKHGYALTRTPKQDTRQQRFNERLGFYRVGEDEFDIHYRIDHLRAKETSCQS